MILGSMTENFIAIVNDIYFLAIVIEGRAALQLMLPIQNTKANKNKFNTLHEKRKKKLIDQVKRKFYGNFL